MPDFSPSNNRPFRLVEDPNGQHSFGGVVQLSGQTPADSDVPVQHVLSLNLNDPLVPISSSVEADKLPLRYPFKYGCGGPEMQYAVRSNGSINILYLSDSEPDEPDEQYVQVDALPTSRFRLEPLTYEQARILGFRSADSYFQPNEEDKALLDELYEDKLVRVGGFHPHIPSAPDIYCHNPECELSGRRVYFDSLMQLPPIAVNNDDAFWYEFQGAYMKFCFGLCRYCGTLIVFNVA